MFDGDDFYDVDAHPIDKDIVGGDDRFAGVGYAPGPVHVGMVGQPLGHIGEQVGMAQRGGWIAVSDIVDDLSHVFPRLLTPDDMRHQPCPVFLASMIARNSAIT